jgi:predicted methyltransferase
MKSLLIGMLILGACATKPAPKPAPVLPTTIVEAVANTNYRTAENTKRDMYRHPSETLAFFGLKPNMNVVEIFPGTGWYMEIIAPLVATEGSYTMAIPTVNTEKAYQVVNDKKIKDWMAAHPEVAAKMTIATYDLPASTELGTEDSADLVVTFRNVHNWMTLKAEKKAFQSFFKVLKPGGVLGVVEHRERPNKYDPLAKSGYVREKDVVKMAQRAGFKLVAKSEINANPKDTKNHPEGVWTLPPSLKLGEKEKAKYLEIGESDRMTLKFIKPIK